MSRAARRVRSKMAQRLGITPPRCPHNRRHQVDVIADQEPAEWHCGRCNICGPVASIHTATGMDLIAANPRSLSDADKARWSRFLAAALAS